MTLVPSHSLRAPSAMVSTVDGLASQAALAMLRRGGSAVDAAIAANAVLTVTLPNQCGLGGDLFAIVQRAGTPPQVLTAAGRAGSGADAQRLRDEGHTRMPVLQDVRSVTVPGCVDGWLQLHERHGSLPFGELLAPARQYASQGFPASPYLASTLASRPDAAAHIAGAEAGPVRPGTWLRRPGLARMLATVADAGRAGFYAGEFGRGLLDLGRGEFSEADLAVSQAEWVEPLCVDVWGTRVWTPPPPSQGYLALAAAWLAERAGVGPDTTDPLWAHLLIEASRLAGYDRPQVLYDAADGAALLDPQRLSPRLAVLRADAAAELTDGYRPGGTTYLCAVDAEGTAVSLIQSICMSFGSGLVVGDTGVWLHNRGIGFRLEPGHPGEYAPGRRPAHTLAPALVTDADNRMRAVLGTRGGDSQPQIVLQLLARLLLADQDPASALAAGRWALRGLTDDTGFDTWGSGGRVRVALEGQVPPGWAAGLAERGHQVEHDVAFSHRFGHAQIIQREGDHLVGAADPRSGAATAAGF